MLVPCAPHGLWLEDGHVPAIRLLLNQLERDFEGCVLLYSVSNVCGRAAILTLTSATALNGLAVS